MYLRQLQAKNEWSEKTFSSSIPKRSFILLQAVLFAALFLAGPRWEKCFPQSPWELLMRWCATRLHASFLTLLEVTRFPLTTALKTQKVLKMW